MSNDPRQSSDGAKRRLTPVDSQQQVFRRATFRGYHEQDVDDFLDQITEELSLLIEERGRLQQQLQAGSTTPPLSDAGGLGEAKRTADDIVRRAREEADAILRAARVEGAGAGGVAGAGALQPFLGEERVFLRDLSRLIQTHADAVRTMARTQAQTPVELPEAEEPKATAEAESEPEAEEEQKDDEPTAAQGGSELFYGED